MRKFLFAALLSSIGYGPLHANSIRGYLHAPAGSEVQLWSMRQHKSELLGSTKLANDSIFLLPMPAHAYHGFYLLRWNGMEMEFLYDGQALSFRLDAGNKLHVIRGTQWMRYRDQKRLLLGLRAAESKLDSQLSTLTATSLGYHKIARKKKRNQRQQLKLFKKIKQASPEIAARTLLFEWHWLGRNNLQLKKQYAAATLLEQIPLHDTLALYHNRWPGFMRMYFSTYAPVDSQPLAPLLLRCSAALLAKAKTYPAYLPATIDFLQWGMEQFEATEAMQLLGREKALFNACGNTNLANQQASFTKPLAVGDSLPLSGLLALGTLPADTLRATNLFVFWSSECPPCLIEFDQLHRWMKHNRPHLQVLATAIQQQEQSWNVEKQAFDGWKHLHDPIAWQGQVARDWQITQLPLYVTSNKNGLVTGIYRDTATLRKALEP